LRGWQATVTLIFRMTTLFRRWIVLLGIVLGLAAPHLQMWVPGPSAQADDRNADGHADIWRSYNRGGRLIERGIDSNFDGRSDVREYYDDGALIRRESDRNFDDRIDLVEEFDTTTHQLERSIADTDFDGTADLLVLFREGRPVFSRQSPHLVRVAHTLPLAIRLTRSGDTPLAPFADPFADEAALHRAPGAANGISGAWTVSAAFVCPLPARLGAAVSSNRRHIDLTPSPDRVASGLRLSRGPPAA
jgi:hypothetical protein